MKLSPTNFNRFLTGDVVRPMAWSKAYACPCFNPASGAANPTCQICGGKGRTWAAEVVDKGALTGMSERRGFANFGTWQPGDALITIPSSAAFYDAGQFDKFRVLDSWHEFSENLTRGTDALTGAVVIDANGDPQIQRVFWLNPELTATVEGTIPALGAGNTLVWPEDEGPPPGTQYSITYDRYDVFYVYLDLPSVRNSGISGLPKKLPVRVFDLFGR